MITRQSQYMLHSSVLYDLSKDYLVQALHSDFLQVSCDVMITRQSRYTLYSSVLYDLSKDYLVQALNSDFLQVSGTL